MTASEPGPSLWWGLAFVVACAAVGTWAGPVNGDFVAMVAQARVGDLADRVTHVGFVAALVPLARAPIEVFPALSALAMAVVAWRNGAHPTARIASLAVVTPIAAFPEVDPAWLLAAWSPGPLGAATAVAVSPAALLALMATPARRWWWAAVLAVIVLFAVSRGDWWWGERGVGRAPPWLPGKVLGAWALALPWALAPFVVRDRALAKDLAWCLPLLLLPPDVPGWAVPALRLARAAPPDLPRASLVAQGVLGALGLAAVAVRVHGENRAIEHVLAQMAPDDGLEAPFSWGSRASFAATGDPYALRWHPPGTFLRDQRAAWCDDPPARVWVLPPAGVAWRANGAAACR